MNAEKTGERKTPIQKLISPVYDRVKLIQEKEGLWMDLFNHGVDAKTADKMVQHISKNEKFGGKKHPTMEVVEEIRRYREFIEKVGPKVTRAIAGQFNAQQKESAKGYLLGKTIYYPIGARITRSSFHERADELASLSKSKRLGAPQRTTEILGDICIGVSDNYLALWNQAKKEVVDRESLAAACEAYIAKGKEMDSRTRRRDAHKSLELVIRATAGLDTKKAICDQYMDAAEVQLEVLRESGLPAKARMLTLSETDIEPIKFVRNQLRHDRYRGLDTELEGRFIADVSGPLFKAISNGAYDEMKESGGNPFFEFYLKPELVNAGWTEGAVQGMLNYFYKLEGREASDERNERIVDAALLLKAAGKLRDVFLDVLSKEAAGDVEREWLLGRGWMFKHPSIKELCVMAEKDSGALRAYFVNVVKTGNYALPPGAGEDEESLSGFHP